MKNQPAAGDGRSRSKVVLPGHGKNQPAAGDGRSSTKAVLPENEKPAGRRKRPFQYQSCTTKESKTSRPPETAVPVLKLYYQRMKKQPATGDGRSSTKAVLPENEDGRSSTKAVLPENEKPAGRRKRPFQYQSCTTKESKTSRPPETAVPVVKLYYQRKTSRPPETAVAVLKLY